MLALLSMLTFAEGDARIVFPANSGVLNVRDVRFGAKGDGRADDTVAINRALAEGLAGHRIVYLPRGTYLVSDTLAWRNPAQAGNGVDGWGPFLQMQGESRAGTVIRLKDGAKGFGDPAMPRAVVQTGSSGSHGNKPYRNGEGNEAFENHLRGFTVDAGRNAGAVGIDWQASNVGAMRHVSVRGDGYCGIALTRRDNGPGLIKDVSVEGFRFGVRVAQEIAQFTLEDVELSGQGEAGLWVRDAVIGVRGLRTKGSAPAIDLGGVATLALFDSRLDGAGAAAVVAEGGPRIYVRNLRTSGFLRSVGGEGSVVKEWASDAPLGGGKALSLGLAPRDTPDWYDEEPSNWAIVGPPSGGDDSARVQAALDAGKRTVFFGYGRYRISGTLRVPAGVRRVQGAGTSLDGKGISAEVPLLRFEGGGAGGLTLVDRIEAGHENGLVVEHADGRTLVLRDLLPYGRVYEGRKGAGPLFLEDVGGAGYSFGPGAKVWARAWNLEGRGTPKMTNRGGSVWVLGAKHEAAETVWRNLDGGRLEAWASFAYTFGADPNVPLAINEGSSIALQMAGTSYVPNGFFDLLVKDGAKELRRRDVPGRSDGAALRAKRCSPFEAEIGACEANIESALPLLGTFPMITIFPLVFSVLLAPSPLAGEVARASSRCESGSKLPHSQKGSEKGGPGPAFAGQVGKGHVLVKNWDFGAKGTIRSRADLSREFEYHDQFGTVANGTNYGAVTVADDEATALKGSATGPQPVEDPANPVRRLTAESLKTFLVPLGGATTVSPSQHNVGCGSLMAKWSLPNGGALLGKDILWETRIRMVTPPYYWFALWNAGDAWDKGAEIDLVEGFGYDNGGGFTNYDGRFWHSNGVGGTDEVEFGNWEVGMAKGGVATYDATTYHVWQLLYRKDDTYRCYVDGREVQRGRMRWTLGGVPDGKPLKFFFLFDFGWGHTQVGSVNRPLEASALRGKFYEVDYSRVYLRP